MARTLRASLVLLAGLLMTLPAVAKQPYTAASRVSGATVAEVMPQVEKALSGAGFEVVGSYHPMDMTDRYGVVVCTDPGILAAIGERPMTSRGGNTIAGAGIRVGLFKGEKKDAVEISFVNPTYLYHAYFQGHYEDVKGAAADAQDRLMEALGPIGTRTGETFGGKVEELEHYHYMIFMPYFENDVELASYDSFDAGLETVRRRLAEGVGNTAKVYEVVLPEKELAVFGVRMDDEHKGVPSWYPKLITRHVAALPYELYLVENKAYMLHGRYRIALSWPELTMATFSNIMDAPPDTERVLGKVAAPE